MKTKKAIAGVLASFALFTGLGLATAPSADAFYWCPGWFCRR